MGKVNNKSPEDKLLRQKAEAQSKKMLSPESAPLKEADTIKLLHELQVHQIELEMQNEELRLARDKAESAYEKYITLYDFAFSGYFTISQDLKICELNLKGAAMLGMNRSELTGHNFNQFITPDTLPIINDFFHKL